MLRTKLLTVEEFVKDITLSTFAILRKGKRYLNWDSCINFINSKEWNEISKIEKSLIAFNLKDINIINLDGLLWLLLIGEILHKKNNYLVLNLPRDEEILKYVKSVNFHIIAAEAGLFEISPRFYLDEIEEYKRLMGTKIKKVTDETLKEVTNEFNAFFNSEEFAHMVGIEYQDQIYWEYIPLLRSILFELSTNIIEHSGEIKNTGHGYVAMFRSGGKINIFISDAGVGFKESLRKKNLPVNNNDKDAIRKALLFKYYRQNTKVEGKGIFEVLKCLRKLGGSVRIRSGGAEGSLKLECRLLKEENEDEIIKKEVEKNLKLYEKGWFPGVQYSFLIDIQRKKYD